MEILHNLWNIVSTEDENLIKYFVIVLNIIESFVTLKLFSTVLNISYTKKQRNIYLIVMEILDIISTFLIPKGISIFLHLILTFIIIKLIFKTSFIKSILAEIIPLLVIVILESIYAELCFLFFKKTSFQCTYTLIYRIPIMLLIYASIYLLSKFIKLIKNEFTFFDQIDSYRKKLLIINLIFVIILIAAQFYLFIFYNNVLPLYVTVIGLVFLLAYSIISIYSIVKSVNFDITKRELEQSELHNKSLELLYNNVSSFKHDFSNIITALGGYIYTKNMDGLEAYYNRIVDECHINNNLSTLNPKIINNPAIYNILATKYYKADELGITINLQIFINLNDLKIDVYDFCRLLGILLDNAIEASAQCEEKVINIEIEDIRIRKYQSIIIENTYANKDVDISKISEKGFTSKTENVESHGIGLWQVSKIIKKYNNVILETTKDDKYFKQEIIIYY